MNLSGRFPLFQTPVELAHTYWKQLLKEGDSVVDATCGNGRDTLFLSQLMINGNLWAIDVQQQAIKATQERLRRENMQGNIVYCCQSHATFPPAIKPASLSLVVYNLGYLPANNKSITTMTETTLQSLSNALPLLKSGGAISIICYPGHEEGKREEKALSDFASTMNPKEWSCCRHSWLNRRESPSLLFIQRSF